ncbi:MAG: sugar phosphate isomerase/epimerase family protein [Leeuwenhoekiella sp.]
MKINVLTAVIAVLFCFSCKNEKKENPSTVENSTSEVTKANFFKLSLAEWSFSGPIHKGEMNPMDFAQKASEMGFTAVEYVSQLYTPMMEEFDDTKTAMDTLLPALKAKSDQYNIKNLLIMVDNEGALASAKEATRDSAVENHKKWVDAAAYLGCHSIRVNLFGAEDEEGWKNGAIDGLSKLAAYAETKNINVLVENHGGFSSNAKLLMEVINSVNKNNCGTLPDFGNFCLKREGGAMWSAPCIEEYPVYEGIAEMMPKAMDVSAKTFNFDDKGQETTLDYQRIMQIIKDSGYTGYIGVEYEGDLPNPEEGIKLTKQLILSASQNLN